MTASMVSATTRKARVAPVPLLAVPLRLSSLRNAAALPRVIASAGMTPNTSPVRIASANVNASTIGLSVASGVPGICGPAMRDQRLQAEQPGRDAADRRRRRK